MNISFGKAKGASEGGKFLNAGIHNAKFLGITYNTIETKNGSANVMALNLDIDGFGKFTHNFFEPLSDERQEMSWGFSASQLDHFLIAVREILEALDPQLITDLDEGKISLDGSFSKCVKSIKSITDNYIGTEVEIKLLPQNNGFNGIPSFVAGIAKNGNLTIRTRFIGHNLTLNDKEVKMIDVVKNATPTDMKKESSLMEKLNDEVDVEDDLPF